MIIPVKVFSTAILISLLFISDSSGQMFWNQTATTSNGNTYASIPNSTSLNITGSFTIEAWICPNGASTGNSGIVSKSKTLRRYELNIDHAGRVRLSTNNFQRLLSRPGTAIPDNVWTHVAGTYNSLSNNFRLYINGVFDTASTIAGANPLSSTDSLIIGNGGITSPFGSGLDEVRVWNRALTASEISRNMLTSLGTTGGIYQDLVLSITFQDDESSGTLFSLQDITGQNVTGVSNSLGTVNQSDRPLRIFTMNDCAEIRSTDNYLVAPDNNAISPSNAITLECWIHPQIATACRFISKGAGASPDYALTLDGGHVSAYINGTLIPGLGVPALNQWTHFAFTYDGFTGRYRFYMNGILTKAAQVTAALISNGSDSLYIGGIPGSTPELEGYIDEVRISSFIKTPKEILEYLHCSIDKTNQLTSTASPQIVYNLDGLATDNADDGGPRLYFRNNARFASSGTMVNQPASPLNRSDVNNFPNSHYINTPVKRIPATGTTGITADTITVNLSQPITDINVFVAINHVNSSSIDITLVAPNGDSVKIFDNHVAIGNSDNIITEFDDNADSSLLSGRYATFTNRIKPANSMNSVFSGDIPKGQWKLRINDVAALDTGFFYAWGIQINNNTIRGRNINISGLIQGFYDPGLNTTITDTMKLLLRDKFPPYNVFDSTTAVISNQGLALFSVNGNLVSSFDEYYITLKHRNSIETWSLSAQPVSFSEMNYDFRTSTAKAFGNNQIAVDASPFRAAIYGGDISKDGLVNLTDLVSVNNASSTFQTGYVINDVTGDNSVNLTDVILVYNNATEFVQVVRP